MHHSLTYSEGSNCTKDHQLYDERKPQKELFVFFQIDLVRFKKIVLVTVEIQKLKMNVHLTFETQNLIILPNTRPQ